MNDWALADDPEEPSVSHGFRRVQAADLVAQGAVVGEHVVDACLQHAGAALRRGQLPLQLLPRPLRLEAHLRDGLRNLSLSLSLSFSSMSRGGAFSRHQPAFVTMSPGRTRLALGCQLRSAAVCLVAPCHVPVSVPGETSARPLLRRQASRSPKAL